MNSILILAIERNEFWRDIKKLYHAKTHKSDPNLRQPGFRKLDHTLPDFIK